jgi:hypothetical protein
MVKATRVKTTTIIRPFSQTIGSSHAIRKLVIGSIRQDGPVPDYRNDGLHPRDAEAWSGWCGEKRCPESHRIMDFSHVQVTTCLQNQGVGTLNPHSFQEVVVGGGGRAEKMPKASLPFVIYRRFTMFLIFLTFILTTGLYGCLLFLACRRVARHLQGNLEAANAVTVHVFMPILGRQAEQKADDGAEAGTLVKADVNRKRPRRRNLRRLRW